MTPAWPQLAGWLATSTVTAAGGLVRGPAVGTAADAEPAACVRFATDGRRLELRWPGGRRYADDGTRPVLVSADGSAALAPYASDAAAVRQLLQPPMVNRDDYHRAVAQPVEVRVAGRLGWFVELTAPAKSGRRQLVVDGETGCLLSTANDADGTHAEIVELTLAEPDDADYAYEGPDPFDPMAQGRVEQRLLEAGRRPHVRLVPGGQGSWVVDADGDRVLVELDADGSGLRLSVAPVGQQPLDPGPWHTHRRTRTIDERVWLLASVEPLTDDHTGRAFDSATWLPPD
jgi:hypothetical protein